MKLCVSVLERDSSFSIYDDVQICLGIRLKIKHAAYSFMFGLRGMRLKFFIMMKYDSIFLKIKICSLLL